MDSLDHPLIQLHQTLNAMSAVALAEAAKQLRERALDRALPELVKTVESFSPGWTSLNIESSYQGPVSITLLYGSDAQFVDFEPLRELNLACQGLPALVLEGVETEYPGMAHDGLELTRDWDGEVRCKLRPVYLD